MAERTRREQLLTFLLTPAVVVGVVVLAVVTFRTTFQIEKLRQQSVLEATVSVANEKADRIDKQIIEEDNVVIAEANVSTLGSLAERWLPTSARETPTIRAVMILDAGHDHDVYDFASQNPGPEDDEFRRLLIHRLLPLLEVTRPPVRQLRHLHKTVDGRSFLLSYWQRSHAGRKFLVVVWHEVPRIVHNLFPRMLADSTGHARVHVVDEEGRTVFGQPTPGGVFTVGRPFETTLYGWRLYATLTTAEELGESVERRRELEMITVAISFLVVAAGVIIVVVAAERERRLAALKSEFVANVSHELKTPLSLVRMFSELLATGRVTDEAKRKRYLSIIMRESERLSALIENVLDFARVERGKAAYHFEQADLASVVLRTIELYRYRVESEGMQLSLSTEPNMPSAMVDEGALDLALVNLIDNAVKYAKDGGEIRVSVSMRGARMAEVRLCDRGPGIPKDEQKRIFDRFVRGAGARRDHVRGSGIGLALVQHIAKSHGGQVWVESKVGEGSCFFLTIPVGDSPSKKRSRSDGEGGKPAPNGGG